MRSTLNNACISALLCGAVLFAIPAVAAGAGGAAPDNATTTSSNAMGSTTDNTTGSTAAASTSNQSMTDTQTPAHRMSKKAQANANAAEVKTTRQLNQQQAAMGSNAAAGTTTQ